MIKNSFVEDSKNKILKNIVGIEKGFDYYLGIVIEKEDEKDLEEKCNAICEKSSKNIKLLKICQIDEDTLLIFELNSEFAKSINGILKSISKYLDVPEYTVTYMKSLQDVAFSAWGEQFYNLIQSEDKKYWLKELKP